MTYKPRTETGTPLDSAIEEMDVLSEQFPMRKPYIEVVKGSLLRIRDEHGKGELTTEAASRSLFKLYFQNRNNCRDLDQMPHILRVVGDDFGLQLGADEDLLWDIYGQTQDTYLD